ncbi:MAG: hypothetical protein ABIH26_01655 [Candidatus Eisenbacteria bacterium]
MPVPTPRDHIRALRRAQEIVEETCDPLTDDFADARKVAHAGSQAATAYQIGKPAGEETVGMILFTCRMDPRGNDLIVECTIEMDHATVRLADDTYRLPLHRVDDDTLGEFVRARVKQFRGRLLRARGQDPDSQP